MLIISTISVGQPGELGECGSERNSGGREFQLSREVMGHQADLGNQVHKEEKDYSVQGRYN